MISSVNWNLTLLIPPLFYTQLEITCLLRIRIQILSTVNSMLDEIRHMKENFALESEEKSIRSNISGHLQAIWTTLQDSRPEKMSGYGRMSTLDKELLSPCILNLLTMLEDIFRQLR